MKLLGIYLILTADIHPIGGMQTYVAGKAKFLEESGWLTRVLFCGNSFGHCEISFLDRYLPGAIKEFRYPPCAFSKKKRKKVLSFVSEIIGDEVRSDLPIIVESQDDITSQWGEIISQRYSAKHVCFICNEKFRGANKYYQQALGFYYFKYKRREIAGIKDESLQRLFGGYYDVPLSESPVFVAAGANGIEDIECKELDNLPEVDFRIAYVGRMTKGYVPNILKGISEFAQSHQSNKIRVIFVGDETEVLDTVNSILGVQPNVDILFLGNRVPIPRALYRNVDVVIAGSGCARRSAQEGVLVIVPDASNYQANGVYGIDTFNALYHEDDCKQRPYSEYLEALLIKKEYQGKTPQLPERYDPEYYYKQHFNLIYSSDMKRDYYPEKKLCNDKRLIIKRMGLYLRRIIEWCLAS